MFGDDDDNTGGAGALDLNDIDDTPLGDDDDGYTADRLPEPKNDGKDSKGEAAIESEDEDSEREDGDDKDGKDSQGGSEGKSDAERAGAKGKPEGSEEGEEEDGVKDKSRIPYQRFKRVVDARRDAEREVATLRAQLAQQQGEGKVQSPVAKLEAELDPLYEQVEEARADGRSKEAAQLQRKIDTISRQIVEIKSDATATQRALEVAVNKEYEAYVAEVETKFPVLNPDDEEVYDDELASSVREIMEGLMARGKSPKAALERAISLHKTELDEAAPAKSKEKDPPTKSKKEDVTKSRNNVDRKIEAAKRNAPNLEDAGRDHKGGKLNPLRMTDSEWDKVPEETKARMRGDYLR